MLYDALAKRYTDPDSERALKSLNILCVRLVFCLYAEDAGIFGHHGMFHDYLAEFDARRMRKALMELFEILDTKPEDRDPYLQEDNPVLAAFPYVNGGLFANEDIEIPSFTEEIREMLLTKASADFDWSEISPTIFGAVFESTLNPETRRSGGMHYTSIENIHKVIDPLFLDGLKGEFAGICALGVEKTKLKKLKEFQEKLASLKFLDPACGSGNFLTETYLSLRRLENEALRIMSQEQITLADVNNSPIKVSISQFYGIEINDFAVTVAKTALWIAESQMMKETESIVYAQLDFLPLKTNAYIVEGNALRLDWNDIVPADELSYIMGNPPFVGQALRSKEQSADMVEIFGKGSSETKLDYVICWYKKALSMMKLSQQIEAAFVSTNSICQGESVPAFWMNLCENGAEIQFAHTSFPWVSESNNSATVHCVIVGFSLLKDNREKILYVNGKIKKVSHINGYLMDAPDIWILSRTNNHSAEMPKIEKGSEPTDGGNLFLSQHEAAELEKKYPKLRKYIRKFIGGKEAMENKPGVFSRYCLWFKGGNPSDYIKIAEISHRLRNIKELRENSSAERIQKKSTEPFLFCQIRQPDNNYIIIPRHSTSSRRYIPIAYMSKDVICGDSAYVIASDSLYLFGILNSNVHNAWTRTICGRLGMAYRYTPAVYNNFPWPTPTAEQKAKIEQTAQAILDARALYPNSSLADLYDELTMPPELRKAHQQNDRAVMQAYGFDIKTTTESSCVAELMRMYQQLTAN